ncbi:MAG: TonB-dependent siderophore receptor [Spongiibacteraceae bacterium]|nr:TonB-dependent siderophore receptor [Spongiibacteraceae bacterium]
MAVDYRLRKRTAFVIPVLALLVGFVSISAEAQDKASALAASENSQKTQAYTLPAGSLAVSLNTLARQGGLTLSVDPSLIQGKTAPAVSGDYTVTQVLQTLLKDSGVEFSFTGKNTVILREPANSASDGTVWLDPVKVSDSSFEGTTEGSGSYTTPSMNTATKLSLSIRETPQSVTVLTRQRLDDAGIIDMLDVVEKTPGLSVSTYGLGRPSFYSRGFTIETVTEDGITSTFSSYIPSPLSNLALYDRVEVVRGSTGLAQGAGNPSAAINLIRKRPTNSFQADVSVSAGSWNEFSNTVDVSGAITQGGKIRARLVTYLQDSESFRDVEKEDTEMLYGTLDFDLSSNTTLNIGYTYLNTFSNLVWGGIPVSAAGVHLDVPRSTFVGADWEYLKQEVNTVYLSVDHQFNNDWTLRLNTKYSNTVTDVLGTWLMADETNGGYGHIYWAATNETDQLAADLFVSGPLTLLGREHELVLGASSNKEEVDGESFFDCFDTSCALSTVADITTWDASMASKPSLRADSPDRDESASSVTQKSVYSVMRWNLSESLTFISGGRLDWYENIGQWSTTEDDGNLSLYGGFIYDFHPYHSAYLSYTDIFKPQDSLDVDQNVLDPVVGENYEIGIKGEYLNGLLNANIAVFRVDQTNLAKQVENRSACPADLDFTCYESTGLVRSEGIDLEIQGEIAPGWQLGAGYTYSHIEYVKSGNVGERLDTAIPERLFKLNTSYTLPGNLNQWRVGAGLTYQSEIYNDIELNPGSIRNEQKAYTLVDLMLEYQPTKHLSIQARVDNAFDESYYRAVTDSIYYGSSEMFGEPRSYRVTLRYRL